MKCPVCDVDLRMAERQGVEIDYCPECRGIWLDRGELDKIIERSLSAPFEERGEELPREREQYEPRRGELPRERERYEPTKRKRKSFLEDIFDFG
ncbi:MAG TPA: hypothetical protein DCY61_02355 [Dehalococcoidia bacterium]|nr:hypothetical protein [Dehalococcoidia bacterium]